MWVFLDYTGISNPSCYLCRRCGRDSKDDITQLVSNYVFLFLQSVRWYDGKVQMTWWAIKSEWRHIRLDKWHSSNPNHLPRDMDPGMTPALVDCVNDWQLKLLLQIEKKSIRYCTVRTHTHWEKKWKDFLAPVSTQLPSHVLEEQLTHMDGPMLCECEHSAQPAVGIWTDYIWNLRTNPKTPCQWQSSLEHI